MTTDQSLRAVLRCVAQDPRREGSSAQQRHGEALVELLWLWLGGGRVKRYEPVLDALKREVADGRLFM